MSVRKFTKEELDGLRRNPYTLQATAAQLRFTAAFKERFWAEYQSGVLPKEILRRCGYEPEMLGDSRINGILLHIKQAAESGETFRSERKSRSPKPISSGAEAVTRDEEIKQLKAELKYIRKEVDFLKKISSVRISKGQVKS